MSSQLRMNLKRKEMKTMQYEKPEIVLVASATAAIQSMTKGGQVNPDASVKPTIGMYESDE